MTDTIDKLRNYLTKEKFNCSEWEKRGLNPSSDEICRVMSLGVNNCCKSLIQDCEQKNNDRIFKRTLKKGLKSIDKNQLDTEEKEFICDCFHELANIVSVDINNELNSWMYGSLLSGIMSISNALKGKEKIIEILSQNCTKCKSKLETFIIGKEEGIPDYVFDIVKCKNCGELNLIDKGPNIKSLRFGEYEPVEQLRKDEYNFEQAKERLEQIKYWRK
ncbi:DUF4844 domain-containing protein [Aquimarina sp. ERC-38]|uniref:DUF4844 domain-containing protein n=1 Tax=Aquimarina sp. ERC-38 TaxID=2949996 RepID=UPI002244FE82|nr:DUF4844 domain-containing protein [Aquimarina sp. ERC-38]UZO80621.1 DUF4844 domain-containing protein [Aquimarina sp. ERC-38]